MKALLIDGPDPWAGRVVEILGVGDTLERKLEGTADEYVHGVWRRDAVEVSVTVTERRKGGSVEVTRTAQVYRYEGERRLSRHAGRKQLALL